MKKFLGLEIYVVMILIGILLGAILEQYAIEAGVSKHYEVKPTGVLADPLHIYKVAVCEHEMLNWIYANAHGFDYDIYASTTIAICNDVNLNAAGFVDDTVLPQIHYMGNPRPTVEPNYRGYIPTIKFTFTGKTPNTFKLPPDPGRDRIIEFDNETKVLNCYISLSDYITIGAGVLVTPGNTFYVGDNYGECGSIYTGAVSGYCTQPNQ